MFDLLGTIDQARIAHQAWIPSAIISWSNLDKSNLEVAVEPPATPTQKFTADNQFFNYDGRIDWKNPQAPALGNPGTSIAFKFIGTQLQIELSEDNWGSENYIDVYLDDNPQPIKIKLRREIGQPIVYDIATGLANKVHDVVIYKRNDYSTGEFKFHSITIDGQLLQANPDSQRTIEVYGDSISAGIAVEYPIAGVPDPQGSIDSISNAYYSYGSILARDYHAEVSLVAQAGVSLVNGFGYWNNFWNNGTGAEVIYDRVKPLPGVDIWDFNQYSPDLVIIAYGQNDAATVGNSLSKEQWKEKYKQMIGNLRAKYPDAYFVGMFPAMFHDPQWDSYITEAIAEYRTENNDNQVFSLIHPQVTSGHPRISEQKTMANTLKKFIDGTLTDHGFNWK
jgi:lysophospholipase L1-like esterase